VPYYYVVSGAVIGEDKTKFAEKIGEIPAYYVPDFLYEFLHLIDENKKNEKLISEFINNGGRTIIDELIKKYSEKLKESKEEKIYFDWYDSKEFSVLEKVEGECSAGLFDLIDYDFSVAKEKINNKELREAIVYISRALLITKGLEIKDDNKAPEFFKKYFIGRHIDEKYSQIIDRFLNNDNDFTFDEIYDFYNAVKNLYEQMDNSLKFPEINKEEKLIKEKIIFKDFRGVPCPLNFVKTKLLLETIDKGETLKILLDDGEPIENVPASLISEGHKILQKNKIGNYWEVLIERG
jgi:sulfite reductase (ferredoxin)